MGNLPGWFPFAILGVGAVFTAFFIWYLVAGGEEEDDETSEGRSGLDADTLAITTPGMDPNLLTTAEEFRSTGRRSRMIALKESLERSLDSRETGVKLSSQDRMKMPWYLLVGADGSGKKTLLANTGLSLPFGPPLEVDSQRKDAGKWWLFDQAVVLEAPAASPGTTAGAQTLPPGQTVADTSIGWNTLLHMLRRERPDSPLNGIIVTISCADLVSARNSPERMEEQADRIRTFLERTRKFLGVRLPIHVLVTKCDAMPGFKSFAEALPDKRRNDIFGWANDADPEARFEPAWVDHGFTRLQGELVKLRDEVLAAPEEVRDSVGVFLFDSDFGDLQEPLKAFVARLMPIGERRPSLFFRGFYFTGDTFEGGKPESIDEKTLTEQKARRTMQLSAEIAGAPHNLVFLKSLFSDKIFKEAGLARPTARFRLSRDRRVVATQAAAIILAMVGGFGLYTSINGYRRDQEIVRAGLKADADALMRVLSGLAIDLDDIKHGDRLGESSPVDRRARDAAVIELVAQMRDVPNMKVRSAFIPSSWFSPLPSDIQESMMAGIQSLVLPVTRQRLQERADRLLATRAAADTLVPDELDASDPSSLKTYLEDVRILSRNITRYNSLADSTSGSVSELSALLDYLFGEQIGADSALAREDFEDALVQASAPKIALTPAMAQTVLRRSMGMINEVAQSSARQLAPPARGAAVDPERDLEALRGLAGLVDLVDPRKGVVAAVSDSAILGVRLARQVEDSVRAALDRAASFIARDTLSQQDAGNRLRTVIGSLFQYRLMARNEGRTIAGELRPNERMRWDIGSLELALGLQNEFLQAQVTVADAFPNQSPDRFRRALEVQLRARALDVAASAQRFTMLEATASPLTEAKTASANLKDATDRLVRLSTFLDSLRAGSEGRKLISAATRQAENALAMARLHFETVHNKYAPNTTNIATWQGRFPFNFVALGVQDTLTREAAAYRHAADVKEASDAVLESIRFLRVRAHPDSVRSARLLSDWETIITASQKQQRSDPGSSLAQLYRLVNGLSMFELERCTEAAAVVDSSPVNNDPFLIRRRQFQAALISRCGTGGAAEVLASYNRLRTTFTQRLAGRYPFADSTYTVGAEADPAAVREFFKQLDDFMVVSDVALRSHPTLSQTARPAITWVDAIRQVRPFVMPFAAEGAPRSVPAYTLLVSRGSVEDTVPLALLELQLGQRLNTVEETPTEHFWRAGDSVKVVLTPFDTARARVLYASAGTWGILRLARSGIAGLQVRFFDPETKVELTLPTFPATAPDLAQPPRPVIPQAAQAGTQTQTAPVTKSPAAKSATSGTKSSAKAPQRQTKGKAPARGTTKSKTPTKRR
jgi:type VI secretion system protein ImpL